MSTWKHGPIRNIPASRGQAETGAVTQQHLLQWCLMFVNCSSHRVSVSFINRQVLSMFVFAASSLFLLCHWTCDAVVLTRFHRPVFNGSRFNTIQKYHRNVLLLSDLCLNVSLCTQTHLMDRETVTAGSSQFIIVSMTTVDIWSYWLQYSRVVPSLLMCGCRCLTASSSPLSLVEKRTGWPWI